MGVIDPLVISAAAPTVLLHSVPAAAVWVGLIALLALSAAALGWRPHRRRSPRPVRAVPHPVPAR